MIVPDHLDWMIWRLVVNKVAKYQEVETFYDINDLWDANEALDISEEAERLARKASQKG